MDLSLLVFYGVVPAVFVRKYFCISRDTVQDEMLAKWFYFCGGRFSKKLPIGGFCIDDLESHIEHKVTDLIAKISLMPLLLNSLHFCV